MDNRRLGFRLLKSAMEDWRWRRLTWQEVKAKYGIGKTSFYKYRRRFLRYGDEGLKEILRKRPLMPHALGLDQKERILAYVYDNPTHGPDRMEINLNPRISAKAIWSFLKGIDLNTRRKRRLWAHAQGKPVLTSREKHMLNAKYNHIDSKAPGELVSLDTFMVCVKSVGKVFQYTGCDTYSSYGWAKVYAERTGDNSIDFFERHILKNVPEGKIKRVLTDQGTEFYSARHGHKLVSHYFTECLMTHAIVHSVTKVAHPWTNGYVERLNQTIWQEFYLCRLTRPFNSIDELNEELQKFMTYYNWKRLHSGYKLVEGGYRCPGHAFYDIRERENIIEIKY